MKKCRRALTAYVNVDTDSALSNNESDHETEFKGDKLTNTLVEFLVATNQAMSLVDNKYFKNFVKALNRKFKLPTRQTITYSCIPKTRLSLINQIKFDLQMTDKVSITFDCWTSTSNDPYLGLTVHYANDKCQPVTSVLALRYLTENHTGSYLYTTILSILNDYGLAKKVNVCCYYNLK